MTSPRQVAERAKQASKLLAGSANGLRTAALNDMASAIESSAKDLIEANEKDVQAADTSTAVALVDRLRLTQKRIDAMTSGLRAVADLPDPVGNVVDEWVRPNGLLIKKVSVPIGVVAVIYEARPNVTADVAGLCIKSGNVAVLRGSSHAINTNSFLVELMRKAVANAGLPEDSIQLIEDTSRDAALVLMKLDGLVDLLIPRGGPDLIKSIKQEATVPFIIDGDGNCHIYVDSSADTEMATAIVINAKTQRPGVCNAAETLLVHSSLSDSWLPDALAALSKAGVEIRGDNRVVSIMPDALKATDQDWATEFLGMTLAVRVVDSIDDAIDHINRWGTSNAEAIVADDESVQRRFADEVDSGSIFVNASTRFNDGAEFGYGAEIGISTQKLHARGPMGLRELTTYKYLIFGDGQVRS